MIHEYVAFVKDNRYFETRRSQQNKYWMYETINQHLRDSFFQNEKISKMINEEEKLVLEGNVTSFTAAKKLLDFYFNELKKE